jgi:hypothetical protein
MVGNAFPVVREVSENLDEIKYVASNMEAIVTVAEHFSGLASLPNHANDAAAASGGVTVGGLYRNGSVLMVRVS